MTEPTKQQLDRELILAMSECRHCLAFRERGFICSALIHGECDCPKCQGFCECGQTAS
jgi:hypothetical protein